MRKTSPPPWYEPRTIQPEASRCTDSASAAHDSRDSAVVVLRLQQWARSPSFLRNVQRLVWNGTSLLRNGNQGALSAGYSNRSMVLTTHPKPQPRLRISGAIPPPFNTPLWRGKGQVNFNTLTIHTSSRLLTSGCHIVLVLQGVRNIFIQGGTKDAGHLTRIMLLLVSNGFCATLYTLLGLLLRSESES